jgi:hypothetical protein
MLYNVKAPIPQNNSTEAKVKLIFLLLSFLFKYKSNNPIKKWIDPNHAYSKYIPFP